MNLIHVYAIVMRQLLLMRRSLHRIFELFYWVTLEMFLWGFISRWLQGSVGQSAGVNFVILLLGALIFWDIFSRTQQTVATSFLEDMWSRNLVNIFAAPISQAEFLGGLVIVSFIRGVISFLLIAILASALYAFHISTLGLFFLPFVANLFVFGWALGFVIIGIIIRFGPSVEILAWSIPVLAQPLSAVFYPVSILPEFLQNIAWFLPTMHMFEGMRSVLGGQGVSPEHLLWASGLNILYFIGALFFFRAMFRIAKKKGFLVRLATE